MNCGKLIILKKYMLWISVLFPLFAHGQFPAADTTFIMSEGTGIVDTVVYEKDSLDIPPHAIYVKVEQGQMSPYKKKYATCLTSMIEASPEDVSNFWKDKFKNEYAIRLRPRKELLVAEQMNLLEISTRMVSMYSKVEQVENLTRLSVVLEVNKGVFVDSLFYPEDYERLKSFLHQSVRQYYVSYYNGVLDNLQKQHDALLKNKQILINQQARISQEMIRNNQEASNARKDRLSNSTIVSKSDSKIRLNEERAKINSEKIASLQAEMQDLSESTDNSEAFIDRKLDRMKAIEKAMKKAQSELEKADKAILNANKNKNKAELRIAEADAKIEQEEQEIAMNQISMELKNKELEVADKKLEIKNGHINQVNRKITKIY